MCYTHGDIPRPFQVPFYRWQVIPIVGILLCILLLINTTAGTAIRFAIWIGVGHIVYFSYSFWHSKGHSRKSPTSSTTSLNEVDQPEIYGIPDKSPSILETYL
jgi:amino acid transporter